MSRWLRRWVAPPLVYVFYWLWSHSWRFKLFEHPEFLEARTKQPVCLAHWHGDELVVVRMGPRYRCAAMTSTSDDGELMTGVLKLFGFGISRGSSTRGGARALLGLVKLMQKGYTGTVAVDGPKGPRHKAKPGVWYLVKHAGGVIVPTGAAASHSLIFEKSWNQAYMPWPFSRVVVSFGAPIALPENVNEDNIEELQKLLETKLHEEHAFAMRQLEKKNTPSLALLLLLGVFLISCQSTPTTNSVLRNKSGPSLSLGPKAQTPLTPKGQVFSPQRPPVIRYISESTKAPVFGLQAGDKVLKINEASTLTVEDFQKSIRMAPAQSVFLVERKGTKQAIPITLTRTKPRVPVLFEPPGTAFIKPNAPHIAYMHQKDMTVYALVSKNPDKSQLQINLIISGPQKLPRAPLEMEVFEKGKNRALAKDKKVLAEVENQAQWYNKTLSLSKGSAGPIALYVKVAKNKFHFEFQ